MCPSCPTPRPALTHCAPGRFPHPQAPSGLRPSHQPSFPRYQRGRKPTKRPPCPHCAPCPLPLLYCPRQHSRPTVERTCACVCCARVPTRRGPRRPGSVSVWVPCTGPAQARLILWSSGGRTNAARSPQSLVTSGRRSTTLSKEALQRQVPQKGTGFALSRPDTESQVPAHPLVSHGTSPSPGFLAGKGGGDSPQPTPQLGAARPSENATLPAAGAGVPRGTEMTLLRRML